MYFPLLKDLAKPQTFIKVKEACKTISVPTLLINGELDPVIAPYATIGMLKTLINKKYFNNTIIKGAKHNPFKDTPEAYNDVIKAYLTKFN
jgi:pimeloyl-ACP methyl ester carboxylesterase